MNIHFHQRSSAAVLGVLLVLGVDGTARGNAIPLVNEVDSIDARVQGCVTCHGRNGEGSSDGAFPSIAGKPAGYLYHQLAAFRDGSRGYPPMNYLLARLPDPYLREIAQYFARQRPPSTGREPAERGADLRRGQALASSGDPQKGVPACVACHGTRLTGMEPAIPGLLGLRRSYIVAQLTRWRVGERHAIEPDCMKRIAVRLADTDVTAVAAWLSQQAPPADLSPESSNLVRMPLACGSQQAAP